MTPAIALRRESSLPGFTGRRIEGGERGEACVFRLRAISVFPRTMSWALFFLMARWTSFLIMGWVWAGSTPMIKIQSAFRISLMEFVEDANPKVFESTLANP